RREAYFCTRPTIERQIAAWGRLQRRQVRRSSERRNKTSDHAAEVERQIAALAGLQRRAVTRFGKTA
ncbi:hypothetical protein, partial [Collinsella aerofaciens]|uniref:hypothetical protein n=1 Tax=Collinsella aerofaciens TaxID=74426 RepID=UPI001E520FFF